MSINVYVLFNGNCRQAIEFYSQVFETKPKIITYEDAPSNYDYQFLDEVKNLVMHAEMMIEGSPIMFADVFPGTSYIQGNHISLSVINKDIERIKSLFQQLKQGGQVEIDLQKTFWSDCYGKLTDQFGVNWQFNHEA